MEDGGWRMEDGGGRKRGRRMKGVAGKWGERNKANLSTRRLPPYTE